MANGSEETIPADGVSEVTQESHAPVESAVSSVAQISEAPLAESTPNAEQASTAPSTATAEQSSEIAPPSDTKQLSAAVPPPEVTAKSDPESASTDVSPPETEPPSEPTLDTSIIQGKPLATSSLTETSKRVSSVTAQKTGAPVDDSSSFSKPIETTASKMSAIESNRKSDTRHSSRASKDATERRRSSKSRNMTSLMSIKRGSYGSYQERSKVIKYMNNYKLESEKPFNPDKVHAIIVQVLTETIEDTMRYDHEICPTKAKLASSLIRSKVKEQEYDRYKLVCVVTIGEKKNYDILTGVRFLWDADRDSFATYLHENMYVFALATVFGLYYE